MCFTNSLAFRWKIRHIVDEPFASIFGNLVRRERIAMSYSLGRAAAVVLLSALSASVRAETPVDLSTWSEFGPPANGTWTVGGGGSFVTQSINGDPTFFVSPNDFFNTTIQGKFTVQTTTDDDFIGFVFGYQSPTTNAGVASDNQFNFLLFDWKQTAQASGGFSAQAGFTLTNVSGTFTTSTALTGDNLPASRYFWGHTDSGPAPASGGVFDVWGTDYGATRGWVDNTTYDFSLLYTADRIKIDIQGGAGDFSTSQTIFDLAPADVGLTEFVTGQFGFYNYSQQAVRYESFTLTEPELNTNPGDDGSLNFLTRVGDNDSLTINVSNTGGAGSLLSGSVTSPTAPFSGPTETPTFNLSDTQGTDFTYTFAPTARGGFNDSIDVNSNVGTHTVNLAGTGVGPVFDSSVIPGGTIDLGVVGLSLPLDSLLTIANITPDNDGGNLDLTNLTLDFQIVGPDAALFDVNLVAGEIIGKGGSLNITVSFLGSPVAGDFFATLVLLTDEGAALGNVLAGQAYSFDLAAAVVPEPATIGLLTLGGLVLLKRRR